MVRIGTSRRESRERALGLLYEAESKRQGAGDVVAALPLPPASFAADLARGVEQRQDELDALIVRFARGWTIARMPVLDRLLLRMGAYELLARPDVPAAVAISEAVELAKRYSTDDSGRFVNGVLGAIAADLRPGEVRPAPPAPAARTIAGAPPPGAELEHDADDDVDGTLADAEADDWFTFLDEDEPDGYEDEPDGGSDAEVEASGGG